MQIGNEGHGERRFLILMNAAPEDVDFILPADFNVQAFVHVFDTRLEEGLVRDDPFILKPGVSFNLMARSMAVFQHSADAKS